MIETRGPWTTSLTSAAIDIVKSRHYEVICKISGPYSITDSV